MTTSIPTIAVAALAGAAAWTAVEYGLHRFGMHELRGRGLASKQHLKHHADVTYFTPDAMKALSASVTASIVLPVTWFAFGFTVALAFTLGMIAMYIEYEITHRRIHTHAPINRYGAWMRKSHFHHHFGGPMRNYGVTVNVWDRLLGTYDTPGVITVPRRHAPVWLLDADGNVKPEYAEDYVVKGTARSSDDRRARDRADAFANRIPEVEDAFVGGR